MAADQTRYVIIGGGAAGMAAAQAIHETDPTGATSVLSEEPDTPYFRPLIPYLVTGKKRAEEMALMGSGPYTNTQLDLHTSFRATRVDVRQKIVGDEKGNQICYDKLLLATGSHPYIPPEIYGTGASGVFALRTLADARRMAQRADRSQHAVMLGGGLLNLKAAFALLEKGLAVTLVVFSPQVLSQLMEPDDADLIRQALDRAGLNIITGRSAGAIDSGLSGVRGVVLDDGTELPCQMVCIGKGVRPNVAFLDGSGIDLDGGIVVDRQTACNHPGVFAAGDVAVTFDPISGQRIMTGLWTNAVEMGRCAGFNMAGKPTTYGGTFGIMNATQLAGQPFVSMGMVHTADQTYEVHRHETPSTYRKLVFSAHGNRLVGVLLVGDIGGAGMYRYLIRENRDICHIKNLIITGNLHYGHLMKG
jgi:nitrite reductase (NADH) large subunit